MDQAKSHKIHCLHHKQCVLLTIPGHLQWNLHELDVYKRQPQAVRIVDDPRSPAVEFTRTPIEVVGNQQQRSRRRNRTVSEETLDLLGSNPTNIGNFLHGDHESMENMMKQFHKFRILDADPRSPSQGIVRTPIAVYTVHGSSSPISANVASPILDVVTNSNCKEATPMETEAILKDPRSPITEVIRTPIQLPIWNDENGTPKLSKPPSEKRNKDNAEILAKKLFGTPEFKDSPLQVDGNQQQQSRRRNRTKSEEALDSLDSSPTNIGNFLLGENEETMDTEMTQFHKLRILDADPRSPSEDIVRTPIMVYTEPESSLPVSANVSSPILDVVTNSNCKEAAPMETEAVLQDPRSPITEVVRTPIQVRLAQCLYKASNLKAVAITP
ncbi:hypothetical protein C0J52_19642 [Blattella germanica]|nr:hypothetical protein C0J52_19642 [Blattella germanica]